MDDSAFAVTRWLSVAAIPVAVWAAHSPIAYFSLSVGMASLILLRHPNNIRRLLAGTEPRLGGTPIAGRYCLRAKPQSMNKGTR